MKKTKLIFNQVLAFFSRGKVRIIKKAAVLKSPEFLRKQLMILAIKKSRAPEAERASIQFLLSEFLHARANFKRKPQQHFPEARLDS